MLHGCVCQRGMVGRRTSNSGGRHEFRDIVVELREPLVKGGEPTVVHSSQLCQLRIRHLPMANNTREFDFGE